MRHCVQADGLYSGVEGAKRFARECGPALLDFENPKGLISGTYSGICVRAYNLKPPIAAKEWAAELIKGMERAGWNGLA